MKTAPATVLACLTLVVAGGVGYRLLLKTEARSSPRPQDSGALTDEVRQRCLRVLRQGLRSEEFWVSIHAAEGLTVAGCDAEVRTALAERLAAEKDDEKRCALARELARAGDRSKVAVLVQV